MIDLDIFDENVFEAVANEITENVHLPNNAADFFNIYLPYYMSVHTDIEISADKIDVANNFCKYVNLVYSKELEYEYLVIPTLVESDTKSYFFEIIWNYKENIN